MEYLVYAIWAVLTLYALGLGLTLLLLPAESRQYTLIAAPWVGYCYAVLISWWIYEFGGQITAFAAQMILLPPGLCLLVVVIKRFKGAPLGIFSNLEVVGILLVAGAIFLFLSIPVFWGSQSLTTVSLHNHDVASYATTSRFFADFTRASSVGFVGQEPESFHVWPREGPFGASSFVSFLGATLGVMPHQVTTLCVNLFASLAVGSLFLVLHDTLQVRGKIAFLAVALFGFHPAFHYLVLQGFFAQIITMGLTLMIFWMLSTLQPPQPARWARPVILLICFTSGLLLTYEHMIPFVGIFWGAFAVALALLRRASRPILTSAVGLCIALAGAAALSPVRVIASLHRLKYYAGVNAGWFLPFFSPDYLFGLSYQNSPFAVEDPQFHLIAATAITTVILLGLLVAFRSAGDKTVALWAGCLTVYAGAIILAIYGNNGQIGGYKSFKLATFFLPFFIASGVCLFAIVPKGRQRLFLILKVLVLVSLMVGYVRADTRLLKAMRLAGKRVEPQYGDLLKVDKDNEITSVNVRGQDGWENMWAVYFLLHKNVFCEGPTYYKKADLDGTYDLIDNRLNSSIRHLPFARIPPIRRINDRFYLVGPFPNQ